MNLFIKPLLGRIINSIKITQVNRLMFFTLLFLGGSKSYSQVFAPVGAKWTYEEFGPRGYGFIVATQFRVEKDTIIDDRYCTILTRHTLDETGIWVRGASEIVSSSIDGDSVYIQIQDSFHLLFNFTAEVGDTIMVIDEEFDLLFNDPPAYFRQYRFSYKIDSISSISIGSDSLLTQYVSYTSPPFDTFSEMGFQDIPDLINNIPGRIIKGIGAWSKSMPLGTSSDISYFVDYYPDYLTCYEDPDKYYSFRGIDCDSLISFYTSTENIPIASGDQVKVYPNPFSSSIVIDQQNEKVNYIRIFDTNGRQITGLKPEFSKTTIDLTSVPAGVYIVSLSFPGGKMKNYRIIKNQ